jgi:hypothetical protein
MMVSRWAALQERGKRRSLVTEELISARVEDLPLNRLEETLAESDAAGYRFLRRVVVQWESGLNRFSRPGRALLVAEIADEGKLFVEPRP